jgi:hypothetical protein
MSALGTEFLTLAALILPGISLTGFETVHWLLHAPVAALVFAGITGICPGHLLFHKVGFRGQARKQGLIAARRPDSTPVVRTRAGRIASVTQHRLGQTRPGHHTGTQSGPGLCDNTRSRIFTSRPYRIPCPARTHNTRRLTR